MRTLGFSRDVFRWCTVHPSFLQLFFITLTSVPQLQTTLLYTSASNTNYILLLLIPKRVSEKSDLLVPKSHSYPVAIIPTHAVKNIIICTYNK